MSFNTGDNPALDGDLLKDVVEMLEAEGYLRLNGLRDRKGYYCWFFSDRDDSYLRFVLTARATGPWFKQPYGHIVSIHRTLLLTDRFGHHLIVLAMRRKPDTPTEFHIFNPDEVRAKELAKNRRHGSLMVNFRFKIGQRWYPGSERLSKVAKRLEERRRQTEALRQQSLYLRADGRLVA